MGFWNSIGNVLSSAGHELVHGVDDASRHVVHALSDAGKRVIPDVQVPI